MTNFEHMREAMLKTVETLDQDELRQFAADTGMDEVRDGAVFSCTVCEKSYGRCNTAYNETECVERYHDWCGGKHELGSGWEDKADIVDKLSELLKATRIGSGINKLALSENRKLVEIRYQDGTKKSVNIEADSGYAIIKDVLAALQ